MKRRCAECCVYRGIGSSIFKRVNGYRNLQGYLKNKKKKKNIENKKKGYKMYIVYKMKRRECSEHKCNYSCEFQKCTYL